MANDQGDWEDKGKEYSKLTEEEELNFEEEVLDPLAVLASELALSITYVEHGIGGFCTDCTCQLGYHCAKSLTEDCELCGCYYFKAPNYTSLTKILPVAARTTRYDIDIEINTVDEFDRNKAARDALKDLTE